MGIDTDIPQSTDILVVGGGIIGTGTAFALSKQTDRDVTLLEKSTIASGATGDSSAILRHTYGYRELYTRMAWMGHQFYRNFEDETGYDLTVAEQPLVRWAMEGVDNDRARLAEGTFELFRELNLPVSKYQGAELTEQYPLFEFDDLGRTYGVSDDTAGYTDGTDAASGMARAAADRGVRIVTGTGVESIDTSADAETIQGVQTEDGYIDCESVVLATGSWTHKLAATADVDLPVLPSREQILLLNPPDSVTSEELATIPTTGQPASESSWWYFRPDFGGTIYMGTHNRIEKTDPDTCPPKPDEEKKLEAYEVLLDFVPELADAEIVGEYCGVYANTPDNGFIIDQVGPDGLYALVGAGHALKHGPVIGHLAADLVLDGESDLFDLSYFSVDRFENRSPAQPLPGHVSGHSPMRDANGAERTDPILEPQ